MPDSPPSSPVPSAGNRNARDQNSGKIEKVSADTVDAGRSCLAAPPRDVGRMLERYGTALPRYLDAHRLRQIEASHQRWPLLRPARRGGASS